MINNGFAHSFSVATLSTTTGRKKEQNRHIGHVSTIMRLATSKNVDLLPYIDRDNGSQNGIKGSCFNQTVIDNLEEVSDREKIKGPLPLQQFFGFCKTLKKITKISCFHLNLKTADLQDLIYPTVGVDIKLKIISFY